MANDGDLLSRWDMHVELVQHKSFAARITEGNVFKLNFSFTNNLYAFTWVLTYIKRWLFINDAEDIYGWVFSFLDRGHVGHGYASTHTGEEQDINRDEDVISFAAILTNEPASNQKDNPEE